MRSNKKIKKHKIQNSKLTFTVTVIESLQLREGLLGGLDQSVLPLFEPPLVLNLLLGSVAVREIVGVVLTRRFAATVAVWGVELECLKKKKYSRMKQKES